MREHHELTNVGVLHRFARDVPDYGADAEPRVHIYTKGAVFFNKSMPERSQ